MSRFAGTGYRPEPPDVLSGLCIVGVEKTADAVLAARDADDHFIFDYQRRDSNRVPRLIIRHDGIPAHTSRACVERYQVRIDGAQEKSVAQDCQTPIDLAAADMYVRRNRAPVRPKRTPGAA